MAPNHIHYTGNGVPDPLLSCGDLVLEALRRLQTETRPAQIDSHYGTTMSFRELLLQTVLAAEGWKARGLQRGDVVALVARNHHEVFPTTLGAVCAGLTIACIVPNATASEMRHAMSLTQPKVVVSEAERLAIAMETAPSGAEHVLLRGTAPDGVASYLDLLLGGMAADPDPDTYRAVDVGDRDDHVPFVLFSSGTTGLPKGVQLRDRGLSMLVENMSVMKAGETIFISSPMCWISGVWQLLFGCVFACTRVFTTTTNDLTIMSGIDKYKANVWLAAPAVLIAFLSAYTSRYRVRYDLSSLRAVLVGGSPTGAEVQTALERNLGCAVIQVYGATEAGFVFGPETGLTARPSPPGSMGRLVPWVEMRLVSVDSGADIPAERRNAVGEVRIRSPYVMHSYISNPEESARALDELRFYKTGDLVYQDDDGFFFFVDRIKEMIKYRNNQIAPAEVEMVLLQHPGVREACVLGKPSTAEIGDLPTAFVSRAANESGEALTEDELQDMVAGKLSDYKKLRGGIFFLDELPRTITGKVARQKLKDRLRT